MGCLYLETVDQMKLTFPLLNTTLNVPVDDAMAGGKKSRRELRRKKLEGKISEQHEKIEEIGPAAVDEQQTNDKTPDKPVETANTLQQESVPRESALPLLMVEVENITHEKFRQTEEVKVSTYKQILNQMNLF